MAKQAAEEPENVMLNAEDLISANDAYDSQWGLMHDFMSLLDMRLYYFYKYHQWVGPENGMQNMMGLVVSRAEFEDNLSKAVETVVGDRLEPDEAEELDAASLYFSMRLTATKQESHNCRILTLITKFGLDEFETNCVLLAFAAQIERKYEKLFAYLQDDITKKDPTAYLAIRLFAKNGDLTPDYYRYFTDKKPLIRFLMEDGASERIYYLPLRLRNGIVSYLLGDEKADETDKWFGADSPLGGFCEFSVILPRLAGLISQKKAQPSNNVVIAFLTGKRGSGRSFAVRHAVRQAKGCCLFADCKTLINAPGSFENRLCNLICEAVLKNAHLCIRGFELLLEEDAANMLHDFTRTLTDCAFYLGGTVFITSEKEWKETGLPRSFVKVDLPLPDPDENERLKLWRFFTSDMTLNSDVELEELASEFRFTPGQIKNSAEQADGLCALHGGNIDTATLHRCCYAQVVMRLDKLATRVSPAYSFDDLILPPDQIAILKEACDHVRYRHTVFQEWGFARRVAYGAGLSMLFSGPPGTGKTMAAQVIANALHMEMYKIQLSQVVSKYIGETEKNLRQVFNEAKNANCILFFDETDALFGKRSEVKDAQDRHANIEVAYLLQQMEEYDGVLILATNLLQNIDAAFMRRIGFVISFPFPDSDTRLALWHKLLEANAPIDDDVDLPFLAKTFEIAGGNIKNIVLHAAFLAASAKSPITMGHLIKSAVAEQKKNNIIVVREDLKEYADLIFT